MRPVRARLRTQDGQVIVFVVAILVVLIGMGALVIDGGRWFQTQRHLQTAADAGALAGVQNLPSDPTTAQSIANTYAQDNYNGATAAVTFPTSPSPCGVNSCIRVIASKTAPGTLAKIFGAVFNSVNVSAKAMAAVTVPAQMKNVAPIAIKKTVACQVPSCYGLSKTVSFDESSVASSTIGLIDLTCHSTSSTACPSNNNVGAQAAQGLDRQRVPRRPAVESVVRRQDGPEYRADQAGARRAYRGTALLSGLRHDR